MVKEPSGFHYSKNDERMVVLANLNTVGTTIINHPMFDGLHHP
jgi:hypothetical protein